MQVHELDFPAGSHSCRFLPAIGICLDARCAAVLPKRSTTTCTAGGAEIKHRRSLRGPNDDGTLSSRQIFTSVVDSSFRRGKQLI